MQGALVERIPLVRGRRHLVALALIVLLAVALRIAWVAYVNVDPTDGRFDDSAFYHGFARSLAERRGYLNYLGGAPSANWPPAYSTLLSVFYFAFGPKIIAVKAVNIALAAAAVFLTYAIGSRLFDRRVGLLGALITALLPNYLYFSTLVMAENLFVPLLLLVVLLLASWGFGRRPTALQSLALGAAIGVAAQARAEGLWLLLPGLVLWFAASAGWAARMRNCALVIATTALVLTPWTVRNAFEFHKFIPIRETTPGTFAIGLNPNYDYYGVVILLNPLDPRAIPISELPTLRDDLHAYRKEPWQPLDMMRRKAIDLFRRDSDGLDWINNSPTHPYLSSGEYKLWRSVANATYYALGVVAIAGLALALYARDRRAWLIGGVIGTWLLGYAPLVPEGRYHLPLLPLAGILAAALVLSLVPRVTIPGWPNVRAARSFAVAALGVAGIVAVAAAASNATVDYEVQNATPLVSSLGETVTLGDLEVVARSVSIAANDPSARPAPPGYVWLTVDLVVHNAGSYAISLLGPAQAAVKDAAGHAYQLDGVNLGPLDSDIGAGQTIEAPAVFAVPANASGLMFVFRAIGVAFEARWTLQ